MVPCLWEARNALETGFPRIPARGVASPPHREDVGGLRPPRKQAASGRVWEGVALQKQSMFILALCASRMTV